MENTLKIALKNFKSNKPKITFYEETFKVYKEKGEVYQVLQTAKERAVENVLIENYRKYYHLALR